MGLEPGEGISCTQTRIDGGEPMNGPTGESMKCYVCGGQMKRTKKDVEANWKGRQVVFRGMEPWVCQSCGEEAYEPDDVRLMQTLMSATMSIEDYPEIMNVEEVADLLRVSTQTVYNLARAGKLPAVKVGREWRFSREKVLEALNRQGSREDAPICEGRVGLAARGGSVKSMSPKDLEIIKRHLAEMSREQGG